MRVPLAELEATIARAFEHAGMPAETAGIAARVHAQSSADGVSSHGLGRVAAFASMVRAGTIKADTSPRRVRASGALEVWDGQLGPGVINALHATDRATALAAEHGIGLVGMGNTHHWMRGGTYGWRAAESGFVLIAWSNTDGNMPPWGSVDRRIGNNPFVMAAPRAEGHLVLDMAMSQYSYGALEATRRRGERLPSLGGFSTDGVMTDDPALIEASGRLLPMGLWKGSGFSIMLDVLSAVLSEGRTTGEVDALAAGGCAGCSQAFIAVDPRHLGGADAAQAVADRVADHVAAATPDESGRHPQAPGVGTARRRTASLRDGIEVDPAIWAEVRAIAGQTETPPDPHEQ